MVAIRAGGSRRETGKLRQLRPESRLLVGAVKTEEAVLFKPHSQTIHKQSQVGCSTVSVSGEPRLHAGMLAMQICLYNRSQLSLPAVPSTKCKHIRPNSDGAGKIVAVPFSIYSVVLC